MFSLGTCQTRANERFVPKWDKLHTVTGINHIFHYVFSHMAVKFRKFIFNHLVDGNIPVGWISQKVN